MSTERRGAGLRARADTLIDDGELAAEVCRRLPEAARAEFGRYLEKNGRARELARATRK
ncbi:MAG: hypothetical protein HYY17_11375 [Planctomycetes bacterium]|nr:hypothetical protein [Planctomycetota bacterium]